MKTSPTPLRVPPWILAEWADRVAVATRHLAEGRGSCPTVLVDVRVVVGIDQELKILRSQNEALRQLREEKT